MQLIKIQGMNPLNPVLCAFVSWIFITQFSSQDPRHPQFSNQIGAPVWDHVDRIVKF